MKWGVHMSKSRKAGDYTVINSMKIGGKEFVIGENMKADDGKFYLVADYECNEIFERYVNAYVSSDYVEIAETYAKRICEEIEKLKQSRNNISMNIIKNGACLPIDNETFIDKIIVLKPEILSPEYRNESYQILRCKGGNGAKADGIGTSVFAKEMFTGDDVKYRRANVMGILKKEYYPAWLTDILECENEMKNPNTFQYGKYHFLPVGFLPKNAPKYNTSRFLCSDKDIRIWAKVYEDVYGKANKIYSHSDFYDASNDSLCDVFKCLENGSFYVPGKNELFKYTGKYEEIGKEKKKSHGEVER
jgi:hypothetical protein